MNLIKYIDVFHQFAFAHPDIAHRPETNESFFTSDQQRAGKLENSARTSDYFMQLYKPVMRLEYDSEVFNVMMCRLRILCKGGDISEDTKNTGIQSKALEIAEFLAAWLNDKYEESPNVGPVSGYDLNSVQFDVLEQVLDGYHGIEMKFNLKSIPFNVYDKTGRAAVIAAGLGDRVWGVEFGFEFG